MITDPADYINGRLTELWHSIFETQPSLVYHYTTAKGLIGILDSNCFFTSHLLYLNDSAELSYGIEIAREVIRKHPDYQAESAVGIMLRRSNTDLDLYNLGAMEWYVICFCEDGNLLSQWQYYGAAGTGDSIGLRPAEFQRYLFHVVFNRQDQLDLVGQVIDQAVSAMASYPSADGETASCCSLQLISHLGNCILLFKDEAFHQEQEWRIIVNQNRDQRNYPLRFREAASTIAPYIEVDGTGHPPADGQARCSLPIDSIVCGPSHHPTISANAVRLLCAERGHPDVTISESRVSIRRP